MTTTEQIKGSRASWCEEYLDVDAKLIEISNEEEKTLLQISIMQKKPN
jgi:peptide chain release factor 2